MVKQKALGKPMWPGYYNLIEPNSTKFVTALFEKGKNGRTPVDMYPWLRQVYRTREKVTQALLTFGR